MVNASILSMLSEMFTMSNNEKWKDVFDNVVKHALEL